jgi:hypothetical protein
MRARRPGELPSPASESPTGPAHLPTGPSQRQPNPPGTMLARAAWAGPGRPRPGDHPSSLSEYRLKARQRRARPHACFPPLLPPTPTPASGAPLLRRPIRITAATGGGGGGGGGSGGGGGEPALQGAREPLAPGRRALLAQLPPRVAGRGTGGGGGGPPRGSGDGDAPRRAV